MDITGLFVHQYLYSSKTVLNMEMEIQSPFNSNSTHSSKNATPPYVYNHNTQQNSKKDKKKRKA